MFLIEHMPLFLLGLCVTACHFWVLLDKGVYWDGWGMQYWSESRRWDIARRWLSEVGVPLYYYIARILACFPSWRFIYKFLSLGVTLANAILIYLILTKVFEVPLVLSWWISLLSALFPAFKVTMEPSVIIWYLFVPVFYLGFFWSALSILQSTESGGGLFFWVGASFLFLSCFHGGILVYIWPFLLALAVQIMASHPDFAWGELLGSGPFLKIYFLASLPFLQWAIFRRWLFVPNGSYQDYNSVQLGNFKECLTSFFQVALLDSVFDPFKTKFSKKILGKMALALSALLLLVYLFLGNCEGLSFREKCVLVAIGMIGWGASIGGAVAVGRYCGRDGYASWYNMLAGFPSALLVVTACASVFSTPFLSVALSLIAIIWGWDFWKNYVRWIGFGAKQEAFFERCRENPSLKKYKIIGFLDTTHPSLGLIGNYPTPTLSQMVMGIWRDGTRLAVNEYILMIQWKARYLASAEGLTVRPVGFTPLELRDIIQESLMPYLYEGLDLNSPQALVVLSENKPMEDSAAFGFEYLRRYFFQPETLKEFLSSIWSIQVIERAVEAQEKGH